MMKCKWYSLWFLGVICLRSRCEDDEGAAPYEISNERANKGLGVDFIPWEQSVKDTVKSLKDKNYILTNIEEQQ